MIEEAAPDGNGAIDFHEFLTIAHNWVIRVWLALLFIYSSLA